MPSNIAPPGVGSAMMSCPSALPPRAPASDPRGEKIMSVPQMTPPQGIVAGIAAPEDILARIERLPLSSWQIKTRIIVGTATFFDAFDALSITYVLPAVVPAWKLTPTATGWLISAGFLGQLIGALVGGVLAER